MKIIKSIMLSVVMLLVLALPVFARDLPAQTNVSLDKEWKITFNQPVGGINELGGYISDYITLYRTDVTPEVVVSVIYGNYASEPNSVRIMHDTPFVAGASYRLSVSPNAVSKAGTKLSDGVNLCFTTQVAAALPPILITPDVIESYIDGTFNGWTGDTIFSLRNGQIWQQSSYAYTYHYAYGPRVTIYKSGGLYKMMVDGVSSTINVTRLK